MSGPALTGVTLLLLGITIPTLTVSAALTVRHRVIGAADAAALAAADTAIGDAAGEPCDRAHQIATRHGAVVNACQLDGLTVTVGLSATVLGIPVTAWARAGPWPG